MKNTFRSILVLYYLRVLKKFVNDGKGGSSLTKLESLILNSFKTESVGLQTEFYAKCIFLDLRMKNEKRSLFGNLSLLKKLLMTRGRVRWLCHHLTPEIFSDAYKLNRTLLFFTILKNWKVFQYSILNRVALRNTDISNTERIEFYEYTHPDTQRKLNSDLYVLENELNQRLSFDKKTKFDSNHKYHWNILESLIRHNSYLVKRYLQMYSHLLTLPNVNNVIELFPQLQNELKSERLLDVQFHHSSTLNFDERLALGGGFPDSASNIEIWHQRFILQEGRWIVIDSTCSPYQDFVAGHWQFLDQISESSKYIVLRPPSKLKPLYLEKAIYLIGRCDENWYHLIMDTLPRYLFMSKISKKVPVLIRSDLPITSIKFLQRVIANPVILLDVDVKVKVKSLYFLASRSTTYDTSPKSKVPQVDFSPRAISLTKDLVLRSIRVDLPSKSPRKSFLPRESKYRNLINSKKILETLESAEFQKVDVNQDFFGYQHAFFANSQVIAAPGGAILANMIFMNPDSKLIVFRSFRDLRQGLWKKLSSASNVHLTQIFGVPTYYGSNKLRRQHSDFYCLNFWLKLIIKKNIT